MTLPDLTRIATELRWSVSGSTQRGATTTLYLVAPSGRRFQLSIDPGWTVEDVRQRLEELKLAPF